MLKAIFFCTFDVTEGMFFVQAITIHSLHFLGPKVLHQVPPSSITSSPSSVAPTLIHFPTLSQHLIPRRELCSHTTTLLSPTTSYRILSHPVSLSDPSYPRNAYTFNFCFVLPANEPFTTYLPPVNKLASLFRTLELQSHYLSSDSSPPNTGKIFALCEILLEDLNNYCECMIPIDDYNTLSIKLFPTYPSPPAVLPHHVPLTTVNLSALIDENWDLTMLRILPYIDGINSVKQIALVADADYRLVKKAIKHLLYYNCLVMLDIFTFGAIYAPTAELATFVEDTEMQEECRRYIALPDEENSNPSNPSNREIAEPNPKITGTDLVELYCSLRQGLTVKSFYLDHADTLANIDIRRFITFGVIKGFLYRVHKYAVLLGKKHSSGIGGKGKSAKGREAKGEDGAGDSNLRRWLDGTHCFDEICTELMISERELVGRLKGVGDVQVIHR